MTQLERDIEKKLRDTVRKHGGQCLKWNCPGTAGVPDRIVLMPGGRIYFIETKRPKGGKLSALQKYNHKLLRELGFYVWVIWTLDDAAYFELTLISDQKINNVWRKKE